MILQEMLRQLETASHPVARAISKGEHFKVLAIAFKKGMVLKEHQTDLPAQLIVLGGTVLYREETLQDKLSEFDSRPIPSHVLHSVECIEDALCLLIQG